MFEDNKIEIAKAEENLQDLGLRKQILEVEKQKIPSTRSRSRVEKQRREAIEKALGHIEEEINKSRQVLRKFKAL